MNDKNKEKIVYSYHPETGNYAGETIARRDPLEKKEMYLIPAYATDIEPTFQEGKITQWNGKEWVFVDEQTIAKQPEQTVEEKRAALKNQLISVRKIYLRETLEFYYPDIPKEILDKRALARQEIINISNSKTLKDLKDFEGSFDSLLDITNL